MASSLKVHTRAGNLPMGAKFTPAEYRPLLLQRMKVYLSGSDTIVGQMGGPEPSKNVGPWLKDGNKWWVYNDTLAKYVPASLGFLDSGNRAGIGIFAESLTANRTATFRPDISGTVAMTTDVFIPRPTITLDGLTPVIDASLASDFYLLMEGDSSFTISNLEAGKTITFTVCNSGTAYEFTSFPSMLWADPGTPVQPGTAEPGEVAMTMYTITYLNVGIAKKLWCKPALDFSGISSIIEGEPVIPPPSSPPSPSDYNPYNIP